MGDHIYTRIAIGGVIPRDALEELADAVNGDFSDKFEVCDEEMILDAIRANEPFRFDAHANYGNVQTVEAFCVTRGLTYVKSWCEGGEYSSGVERWKPGMKEAIQALADGDGKPAMDIGEMREALAKTPNLTVADLVQFLAEFEDAPALALSDPELPLGGA